MIHTTRCPVCKNLDLKRLVELGWNAKMSVPDLSHAFGGVPSHAVIYKHLKEHTEGAYSRDIPVEDARPVRQRVLDIQRAQIDAIERQMASAQQRADDWNEEHREHVQNGGCLSCEQHGFFPRDASYYFDILSKDMQAAVASILKAQGLTDKRELKADANKTDLFRLMIGERGGLAPKHLIEDGRTVEGDFKEVSTDGDV